MSTKKDKFSFKDKIYMRLAINLANARKGLTGENPSVGCVIVKKDEIISIGQTGFNGRPHAETNAIKNSTENLLGSKMYVTLEPCNHYGKTPPCTKSIINSGISEVFYSIDDIDSRTKGKSYNILNKKKIKVRKGLLKNEAEHLYNSYKINRNYKLPYVTAKIAISKNKLIYSEGTKRITNQISDKLSHYLRFKNDAIMISVKTLNTDNPRLDCRLKGYENFSPIRVILDKNLDIKLNTYILRSVKKNNTIIFYNSTNNQKLQVLKRKGAILIKTRLTNQKLFNLKDILKTLFLMDIRNLLVEGGDKITKNMINHRLINEFYLFQGSKVLSKSKKHIIFSSFQILNKRYKKLKNTAKLAKNIITIYKR